MQSRRHFIKSTLAGSTLVSVPLTVPTFLARVAEATPKAEDSPILVVIELGGGNDGINTVVPFADEEYARNRKRLRLPKDRVIRLSDSIGLHPAMSAAGDLWEAGSLCIVQGVGYPNPSRSHFKSMAIWQTANVTDPDEDKPGWLGRAVDDLQAKGGLTSTARNVEDTTVAAAFVGNGEFPSALRSARISPCILRDPEQFTLASGVTNGPQQSSGGSDDLTRLITRTANDSYATAEQMSEILRSRRSFKPYPPSELGRQLRTISQLLQVGLTTRVFYARQSGYDTHAVQLATHGQLLGEFSAALKTFLDDLKGVGLDDRVLVMAFSEFGRRVRENASAGTDHGTAGPVLLAGTRVRGGFVGAPPSLSDLESGDLKMSIDFRRVYATILRKWLASDSSSLDGHGNLPLLKDA